MIVKVSETTNTQLDWLVAKALGYTLREPITGTNEEARKLAVPFTMYEVNYKQNSEGITTEAWVEPVTVTRFGINREVGATAESVSLVDSLGRKCLASVDMFYFDPAEAQLEVNGALVGYCKGFRPTAKWAQAGPILEREKIELIPLWLNDSFEGYAASHRLSVKYDKEGEFVYGSDCKQYGQTPLIAAMRCFCHSKLGEFVDIPEDLK